MRDRRGNAVIEMAILLPLLLLIVFGITEFGRAWMTMNVLVTASREGARLAIVMPDPSNTDKPTVVARAAQVTSAANIDAAIDVTGPDPADPLRRVTVTVATDFDILSASVLGAFHGTIPLHATTTMRHESL